MRNIVTSIWLTAIFSLFVQSSTSLPAHAQQQKQSLHRVDFKVEGASCVTCLRRVAKAMRETKGVLKADVSIYKPYWAIAIYDAKATNFQKISEIAKVEKVRFTQVEDKAIAQMPLVVIPKLNAPPTRPKAVSQQNARNWQ